MEIKKDTVVTFHYTLRDAEGQSVESTEGNKPATCLYGHGGLVRGLERAMKGHAAGDAFSVTVAPEDAFGMREEGAVKRVPIKHFAKPRELAVGEAVVVNTQQGRLQGTVLKIGKFNVDLDFNHPMAGRTLEFDVKIIDVRDATAEEIAHRHVHE